MSNIDWSAISGACIGSFFYTLLRLQPYLENRTFDPKYNSAYFTRLVTGIVAGVILAYFLKDWLFASHADNVFKNLSTGSIGILGGFSAEAVQEFLQRVKDVLLAVVRGDNSAQIQAKAAANQSATFADVRDKLGDIEKANTPAEVKKAVNAAKASMKRSGP